MTAESPPKNFEGYVRRVGDRYHVSSRGATSRRDNANLVGRIIISRPVRDDDDVKKAEGLAHGNSTGARFYFDVDKRLPSRADTRAA